MNLFMNPTMIQTRTTKCQQLYTCTVRATSQRHQSSYRRNRIYSNVKPNPDFLPSKTEAHDHIIYNPPPSMPNIYHTPSLFLPKDDKRTHMQPPAVKSLLAGTPAFTPSGKERLPPAVRQPYTKRYHLTEKDMDEMRRLRSEDPLEWSAKKLAKKFDCSVIFVSTATEGLAKQKKVLQQKVTEVVKSRWGSKRRTAREDRALRRERWYQDA